ncbi:MAG: hypothetical protein AMXMBFR64_05460 [Myxococcales bacterium]
MATLRHPDGRAVTDLDTISAELAPLGVSLSTWPVGDDPELRALLARPALADAEKEQVLAGLDHYFQQLRTTLGYAARDLVVLHPELPGLDAMLAKFDRVHTHADDEVRYIVDGEGVFGFVRPDGSQVEVTVTAEEYVNVPAGTEHWFHLTAARRIKAVRYFVDASGWTPEYTDRPIAFRK